MRRFLQVIFGITLFATSHVASADPYLQITVNDGFIAVDGTSSVNVTVESVGGPLDLFLYDLQFTITPNTDQGHVNVGSNNLSFLLNQSGSYLTNSQYVFFNDSLSAGPPLTPPSVSPDPEQDILNAGDSRPSFTNVSVSSSKLLITLELDAKFSLIAGDEYRITLDPSSSFSSLSDTFDLVPVVYSATSGLIVVTPSAVPEPATALLVLIGLPMTGLVRRMTRRHAV